MALAPQIQFRDGSGFTQALVFTTNQEAIFINGQVDTNTADIQVSVNGAPFVSDASLVKYNLPQFTVPNPDSYPTGLILEPGVNTILIRTIDIVGGVSGASSVEITKVGMADVQQADIPTGIRVRRRRNSVDVLAAYPVQQFSSANIPVLNNFLGFNYYASTSPGGSSGYFRINESTVTKKSTVFEEDVQEIAAESLTWANAFQKNVVLKLSEVDEFGNELSVRLEQRYDVSTYNNNLRFISTLESQVLTEFVTFNHVRAGGPGIINEDQFANVADTDPLYYVVSGVYYDPTTGQEIESPFSQEVVGLPLVIDTGIRDLPGRTSLQIQTDFINLVQRVDKEVSLIPGSTTRDVSIDPFSSEAARLYFILDFVHRAQSFLTLLQIDDANNDGVSDPVDSSSYKVALRNALGFTTNLQVQNLIDAAFDKLAGNVAKKRLPGRPSVGQVVFYSTSRPSFDVAIPAGTIVSTDPDVSLGIPAIRYRVGGTYTLSAASADAFYNFDTKRYEIVVDIVAEQIGESGNRPASQITNVQGINGFSVTNTEATVFGSDRESNADLAARAMLGFVSVDTGTEGGYASTSAEQIGIVKAKVVKSGDSLMMRDYDPVRRKHIGGKVDVWIQGLRERQVTETFAFTFEVARDITCQIIDVATLTFRVQDSRVTPDTPITEVLNSPSQGLGVRNVTKGLDYDLTGLVIIDYQTFRLNPNLPTQPVTAIDDVVTADYRFRVVNQFKFTFQPVRRVVSVVGEISGALNPQTGYSLFKTDDPLLTGESTIANDYLTIKQVGGIPSGDSIVVNDEHHVLIGSIIEPLLSIGINTKTIRVFNQARTVEYSGPSAPVPDFDIIEGTPTTPAKISRTSGSTIPSGSTVSVDYVHDENFKVTYVINDLLQQLQTTLNARRHITADVVVKQAIENPVEIETTIQLLPGATRDKADPAVRTNVSQELNRRLIGQGFAQSDFISTVDSTQGVDFQVIPIARMAYADGSLKLRESISSASVLLSSLSIGGNLAWILTSALRYSTTDQGGLVTEHHGVFQDDEILTMANSLAQVASQMNQAFIIGSQGAIVQGYTDSVTLIAEGFTSAQDQQAEILRRTANHVVVSLSATGAPQDIPDNHKYAASYVVRGDVGAKDITASGVEFIDLSALTITFREAPKVV